MACMPQLPHDFKNMVKIMQINADNPSVVAVIVVKNNNKVQILRFSKFSFF